MTQCRPWPYCPGSRNDNASVDVSNNEVKIRDKFLPGSLKVRGIADKLPEGLDSTDT